jgi:GNAT superfamily N-acetyltransferase
MQQPADVRVAAAGDLGAIQRIQRMCYRQELVEGDGTFLAILAEGRSLVAVDRETGQVVGFALVHLVVPRGRVPLLHEPPPVSPPPGAADLFVHDVCVHPSHRRKGVGSLLAARVTAVASALQLDASLVSVNGSEPFWRAHGFRPDSRPTDAELRKSYGGECTVMRWEPTTQKTQKVFIAPFKSATTSVGRALEVLGCRVMGHRQDLFTETQYALIAAFNAAVAGFDRLSAVPQEIVDEIRRGLAFVKHAAEGYDAFQDWPLGHDCIHPFVKKTLFPDCKFVYMDREMDAWLGSVRRWVTTRPESHPHCDVTWQYPASMRAGMIRGKAEQRGAYAQLADEFPNDVLFLRVEELDASGWTLLRRLMSAPPNVDEFRTSDEDESLDFPKLNANPCK